MSSRKTSPWWELEDCLQSILAWLQPLESPAPNQPPSSHPEGEEPPLPGPEANPSVPSEPAPELPLDLPYAVFQAASVQTSSVADEGKTISPPAPLSPVVVSPVSPSPEPPLTAWAKVLALPLTLVLCVLFMTWRLEHSNQVMVSSQRQTEQDTATSLSQQEVMAQYLDQMAALLLSPNAETAAPTPATIRVMRARTLATLRDLDQRRKGVVLRFLYETDLITNPSRISLRGPSSPAAGLRLPLQGADLTGATLSAAFLWEVNLQGTFLNGANFTDAELSGANLESADLQDAILSRTNLSGANLDGANLRGANLQDAVLAGTSLDRAVLCQTTLPDGTVDNRDCQE